MAENELSLDEPLSDQGTYPATIRQADQLLVIDNGRLIERGTHDSLLAQEGFYYNLYMSQFRRTVINENGPENIETQDRAILPLP